MRARIGPALYSVMEPGDQIVAGALTRTGPPLWVGQGISLLILPAAIALIAVSLPLGANHGYASAAVGLGVFLLGIVHSLSLLLPKHVIVAVTRRQLICYRLTVSDAPSRLMFATRLPAGSVTRGHGSLRYTGPDGKSVRLNVGYPWRGWRQDLREVADALQASGVMVQPAGRVPALPAR
jgi:hypothetical protein